MSPLNVITAPARLALTVAGGAAGVAIDVLKGARGLLGGGESEHAPPAPEPEATRNGTPKRPVAREPVRRPAPPPPPAAEPPAPAEASAAEPAIEADPPEEEHIDEGAVLVAEVAETGAEDGAGPELDVEEPWEGYDRMKADEITERLSSASTEAVAAVQLYEAVEKNRDSVLEAAEGRLRELTPPPSQSG
jgi:hypothetical protein